MGGAQPRWRAHPGGALGNALGDAFPAGPNWFVDASRLTVRATAFGTDDCALMQPPPTEALCSPATARRTGAREAEVRALNQKGAEFTFRCGGLLARAIQHEVDHLNGILFIDRMTRADKDEMQAQLDELQAATKAALKKGK